MGITLSLDKKYLFRKNLAIAEEDFIYARFCPVMESTLRFTKES